MTLLFQQRIGSRSLALVAENRVKRLSRSNKDKVINLPGYLESILSGDKE